MPDSDLDRLFVFVMAWRERGAVLARQSHRNAQAPGEASRGSDPSGADRQEIRGIIPNERIFVLTNASQLEATKEVVPFLPERNIVAEPVKRDTAPAAALATAMARQSAGTRLSPSSPPIPSSMTRPHSALSSRRRSFTSPGDPSILTFSITPTHPSTGFGYLELEEGAASKTGVVAVKRFVEKPDEVRARSSRGRSPRLERRNVSLAGEDLPCRVPQAPARP